MPPPLKPPALRPGDGIRVLSPASPVKADHLDKGCEELSRLGYRPVVDRASVLAQEGFFAGSTAARLAALEAALVERDTRAIFCSRGGYGSNYLLDGLRAAPSGPKILLGSSDVTSLQIYLWKRFGWVTFYGPMVAQNFDRGEGASHGYERASLLHALSETGKGWRMTLEAETVVDGVAEGVLLGGCLTLVEATLGTPWELDTRGAILVLEDRAMRPYQVDRALAHLRQAGKFREATGFLLGDFPECEPPAGSESVRDVARRILAPLGRPVVWGAPVGHTARAALTLPLGVRARLLAQGPAGASPQLDILEPACVP